MSSISSWQFFPLEELAAYNQFVHVFIWQSAPSALSYDWSKKNSRSYEAEEGMKSIWWVKKSICKYFGKKMYLNTFQILCLWIVFKLLFQIQYLYFKYVFVLRNTNTGLVCREAAFVMCYCKGRPLAIVFESSEGRRRTRTCFR